MYLNWLYYPKKKRKEKNMFENEFIIYFKFTSSSPRTDVKDDLIDCCSCCFIVTQSCKSV